MRKRLLWITLAVSVCLPSVAPAQTPTCDSLQPDKKQLAVSILQTQHPYACCDGTILECLAKRPRCILARRLADDVCRRATSGHDKAAIERALTKRGESMMRTAAPAPIDLAQSTAAGEPDSKVVVVAYACLRCPYCSKVIPALHQLVADGPLKGKAKLYLKAFPTRSHEFSTEAGKAALAAQQLGRFWPFVLHTYSHFDDFAVALLPDYAVSVGMDRSAFVTLSSDPAVHSRLAESKKEGIRNRVEATPTVFLSGFRLTTDLSMPLLQDLIEEEHERLSGRITE